jgi:hypothetical protein
MNERAMDTRRTTMRTTTTLSAMFLAGLLAVTPAAADQPRFASPEDALAAFAGALQATEGSGALLELFGQDYADELIGADPASVRQTVTAARNAAAEALTLAPGRGPDSFVVLMGRLGWPMPIPIVQENGDWHFDTAAGLEEVLDRRIGENELAAIAALRAYVRAQREYGSVDRNGDGVPEFAQRLISSEGQQDGLFWPAAAGEQRSPLGLLAAEESDYLRYRQSGEPYYGYRFKILTQQGENAPGGAYDYVINDRMIAGFALVAWPADYGNSGIMTFKVSHLGQIYEADLGDDTETLAAAIDSFDPDPRWTIVGD